MESFSVFDKLNVPMYICENDWRIIYRNKVCKKYTTSPRLNGNLKNIFVDKENTSFPEKNGEAQFIGCFIKDTYKTAICFEFKTYAVVMFPTIFDFDLLFGDLFENTENVVADVFRDVLDAFYKSEFVSEDRYGMLEKLRQYTYSAIERYVTLSFFSFDRRGVGSFQKIYSFFTSSIVKVANKAGYRIETNLSDIAGFGENLYTDTTYFSVVLSGVLLFGLALSSDKKCIISPEYRNGCVRNTFNFTYNGCVSALASGNSLKDFIKDNPAGYINVMLYDELCKSLGWRLGYKVTDAEKMNLSIYFEIDNDNGAVFRSAGQNISVSPEEIISMVIENIFAL